MTTGEARPNVVLSSYAWMMPKMINWHAKAIKRKVTDETVIAATFLFLERTGISAVASVISTPMVNFQSALIVSGGARSNFRRKIAGILIGVLGSICEIVARAVTGLTVPSYRMDVSDGKRWGRCQKTGLSH